VVESFSELAKSKVYPWLKNKCKVERCTELSVSRMPDNSILQKV